MLADDAVLRPESDGEQGSIVGKPYERHVLPSISLQASVTREWTRGSGFSWAIETTIYVL